MNTRYLEFEVSLLGVRSRLWRRFLLRQSFSFEELHGAIQMACGWEFNHLYEFRSQDDEFIACAEQIEDGTPAGSVPLKSYFKQPGQECLYIYDLGDYWKHRVTLVQKVLLPERFVQRLTGGKGMFPPEDCGGESGYEDCVRAFLLTSTEIGKLDPEEQKEIVATKEWLGDWRPDGFDLETTKRRFER